MSQASQPAGSSTEESRKTHKVILRLGIYILVHPEASQAVVVSPYERLSLVIQMRDSEVASDVSMEKSMRKILHVRVVGE